MHEHTPTFTAARDALTLTLAPDGMENPAAVWEAFSLTGRVALTTLTGAPAPVAQLPAPADPAPAAILTAARDALGEHAAAPLPAWGTAERGALLTALLYAVQVLDTLHTLHSLGGQDAPPVPTPDPDAQALTREAAQVLGSARAVLALAQAAHIREGRPQHAATLARHLAALGAAASDAHALTGGEA